MFFKYFIFSNIKVVSKNVLVVINFCKIKSFLSRHIRMILYMMRKKTLGINIIYRILYRHIWIPLLTCTTPFPFNLWIRYSSCLVDISVWVTLLLCYWCVPGGYEPDAVSAARSCVRVCGRQLSAPGRPAQPSHRPLPGLLTRRRWPTIYHHW